MDARAARDGTALAAGRVENVQASGLGCLSPHARRPADLPCAALPRPQALVDFPGQTRRVVSFKRMALTDLTVEIPRLAKKAVLKKAIEEAGERTSAGAWRGREGGRERVCVGGRHNAAAVALCRCTGALG